MGNGASTKVSHASCAVPSRGQLLILGTSVDYILFIKANVDLDINKNEVQATQYVNPEELKNLFNDPKLKFTPWFKLICESMLFEWWAHLDSGLETYTDEQEIRRM